ncbi:hypothetical protein [Streptomyces sp. NPDC004134]
MTYRFTARAARTGVDPDGYFTGAALAGMPCPDAVPGRLAV